MTDSETRREAGDVAAPLRKSGFSGANPKWFQKLWLNALGMGAVGFGGLFSVFSYIKPTMLEAAQLPPAWLPAALALLGLGMVAGNWLGPKFVDRGLMRAIAGR